MTNISKLTTISYFSGIIAEKPSEELFALDTKGSEPVHKAYNKIHKPLKLDQILAQRSAIPAIDSRKRPSRITDGVTEPSSKRRKSNGVSPKEYLRLQSIAYGGERLPKDAIKDVDEPNYDPWAPESNVEEHEPRFNFLPKSKPIRAPSTIKDAPISLVEGASNVPAVPKPKAGASYNPIFEDYDRILVEEGMKEVEAERQRLREAEIEQGRLYRIEQAQKEEIDWQTEDESAWEGIESEYECEKWSKKRRPERKTPAERNRAKRRKEAERQTRWEAQMRKKAQQAQRIKEIAREVSREERTNAVTLTKAKEPSAEHIGDEVPRRRKLGKSR